MQYHSINNTVALKAACAEWEQARVIAFDTEFVSENSYRPELCLVQVAVDQKLYVIDPLAIGDLTPFWERLAQPGHTTLVHAGREELRFSWRAIGRFPHDVFDVQLAAGFVGLEYPAAYSTLVSRLLRKNLAKGETRTDWRRRPLSANQIEYALQDVLYLDGLRREIMKQLDELQRTSWVKEELERWQRELQHVETSESWRRVSGASGLHPRGLAVVRALWRWREAEAERQNSPPRRILRDDLLVELARRQTADPKRIRAVRGLERRNLQRFLPTLAREIETALALPEDALPRRTPRQTRPPLSLVGQFLATALGSICRQARIAPGLVGSVEDLRDLVAARLEGAPLSSSTSPLLRGWRAEVVGRVVDDLLAGKYVVRIADPRAEQPLELLPWKADEQQACEPR